jgi:ABC-type antimicrobial peptide transport system permease subunit
LPLGAEIPQAEISNIQSVKGVAAVTPMLVLVNVNQLVPANVTIGIPLGNFSLVGNSNGLELSGSYPSTADGVVIGSYLAEVSNLKIGSNVKIGSANLTVSGIMTTPNLILQSAEIVPLQTAQSLEGYNGLVSAFLVTPGPSSQISQVIQSINSNVNGLVAINPQDSQSLTDPLQSSIGTFNSGIGIFSALVAFLFVAVIAIVNLSEQKEELSTIRSIGSSSLSILKVTLSEIGFITLFGAVLGLGLAAVATALYFHYYGGVPLSLSILSSLDVIPGLTLIGSELGIIGFGLAVSLVTTIAILRRLN